MNLKEIRNLCWIVLVVLVLYSCKTETSVNSFYSSQTECLGMDPDGSQILRVWGTGKNKADAVRMAKKNAIQEVLFKGVPGNNSCSPRPLVTTVNAQEKYEDYFNRFFSDKGDYRQYVNTKDEKTNSKIQDSNKSQQKYGVVVTVLRSELRNRMVADGIIKQ